MTTEIGVAVIGMGWMGEAHSRAYRGIPDRFPDSGILPRLVVIADPVEARTQAALTRFGFERSVSDWREVLDDPDVEVVDVTAPNGLHLEINEAVAAAGKHLACEKPVGRTPEEALQSAEAARKTGIISSVGFNYRWAPLVQYARQLIADGALGELTHYHGRFHNGYAGDPLGFLSWRFEEQHGLGTLGDLMPHVIDMAHLLAGPIERLVADRQTFITERPLARPGEGTHYDKGSAEDPTGPVTNEDYVTALVRFSGGARGVLEACRIINGPKCDMAFEVHGTKGAVAWTMERMNELQLQTSDDDAASEGFRTVLSGPAHPFHGNFNPAPGCGLGYDDLKTIEAYNFLRGVARGEQGDAGLEDMALVARVEQAIMRSWESAGWSSVEAV